MAHDSPIEDCREWSPHPIIEMSLDGEIIYFNLVARANFPGISRKGVNHPLLANIIEQIESTGKNQCEFIVFSREVRYLNRVYDQQIFSISNKNSIYVYINDVTSHKHIEKQLNIKKIEHIETTALLNNILESSREHAIIATGLEGNILIWNEGAHRTFGYSSNEIINYKNIEILYTPDDIRTGKVKTFFETALQNEKTEDTFYQLRKDGSLFVGSVVATLRRDNTGHPLGFVVISKDITKQKQLEEQLIKNNQELEQFAYITSHDLKAPLRAIESLSVWIEEDCGDKTNPELKEHLALMRRRVTRMRNLINGILQYSRLGRANLNIDSVDTKQLLQEIIDSLAPPKKFTIRISEHLPTVQTDKTMLEQVFSNLISNSIKYHHRDDGIIEIGVQDENAFYAFYVADDGPGIEEQYHEKIFQIFQTLQSKDVVESTGIGLSIVKKIVESQGGEVTLTSIIDKGTTFRFTWPKQPHVPV